MPRTEVRASGNKETVPHETVAARRSHRACRRRPRARPGRGGRQRLQLVRLHRRGHDREVRGRDRDQGQLRRLRQQRAGRGQAPRRQLGLRRRRPLGLLPRAPGRGRPLPAARQVEAPQPRQHGSRRDGGDRRARSGQHSSPSTTCGAPPAIGYNVAKVKERLGDHAARHLGPRVQARGRRQARRLRRDAARCAGRDHGVGAQLSRARSELGERRRPRQGRSAADVDPAARPLLQLVASTSTISATAKSASRSATRATCSSPRPRRRKPMPASRSPT